MIGDNKNILHSRGLVELHVHLNAHEIHVHKLQGHVHSDGTQWSLQNAPLKSTATLTPPDHSFTILDQRRPPESLLGESQHSSLTLMSSIPMNTIKSDMVLVHRHHECGYTLRLSLRVQRAFSFFAYCLFYFLTYSRCCLPCSLVLLFVSEACACFGEWL